MKRLFHIILLFSVLASVGLSSASAVSYAQGTTPTATPSLAATETATPEPPTATPAGPLTPTIPTGADIVSFPMLGYGDDNLRGPFASKRMVFGLPNEWQLLDGAEFRLDITTFSGVGVTNTANLTNTLIGTLDVFYNTQYITTIALNWLGQRTLSIPLPSTAYTSTRNDGRHDINLFFASTLSCEVEDTQPTLRVSGLSYFVFPHRQVEPTIDLARLPLPIYQQTFLPDQAMLVMPNEPSPSELEAAIIVASAIGDMTNGNIQIGFVREDELLAVERDTRHLIFVGQPTSFKLLAEVTNFPAQALEGFTVLPDDGIVQMVISPWNPTRVVVLVSGNTAAGLNKAAQAFSTAPLRPLQQYRNLAIIERVQADAPYQFGTSDQTLADLNYKETTFQSIGSSSAEYRFFIPPGQSTTSEAYLDLSFNHATFLNYDESGLLVNLNDSPIGTVLFNDASATAGHQKMNIIPTLLRPGINRLTIQAELLPRSSCLNPLSNQIWVTVRPETLLHIPLVPIEVQSVAELDLDNYPRPFANSVDLSTVALVVPPLDPQAWRIAAQIAYYLGDQGDPRVSNLKLVFADNVPEEVRQNRDLILIGRPSQLALLAELNDFLPAPFVPGSDLASENNSLIVYRLPANASLGYVELLAAPWNPQRTILALLGNTPEALQWVGEAMVTSARFGRITGNFAVISSPLDLYSTDTRDTAPQGSLQATAAPGGTPEPLNVPEPDYQIESWVQPVLYSSSGLMLVIGVFVAVRGIWWRTAARRAKNKRLKA